jgi:hypothetical protein
MFGQMDGEFLPTIADISAENAGFLLRLLGALTMAFIYLGPQLSDFLVTLIFFPFLCVGYIEYAGSCIL